MKEQQKWTDENNKWFFDLHKTYKHKIVIEFGGHDHWEDVRVEDGDSGNYRNIFVSAGVSPVFGQLPGVSTLELDLDTMVPSNLRLTSLDITSVYGKTTLPRLEDVPYHTMNFADYGIDKLDSNSLEKGFKSMKHGDFEKTLHYISDKLGFDHTNPKLYEQGLALAASWSLINPEHTHADGFFCQALHAKYKKGERKCVEKAEAERQALKKESELFLY